MSRPTIAICITAWGASKQEAAALPAAVKSLNNYFEVKIWPDILARDIFESQTVSDRIASLNWAFQNADIVLPWKGGFNSIELLFAFEKIKPSKNTVFVGLSDNTILTNALPVRYSCRAWQGPNAWNWVKNPEQGELWARQLKSMLKRDYQTVSKSYKAAGYKVLQPGTMVGKIWGGNNYSFDLLQGTEFCPDFSEPYVLFMEGEDILKDQQLVWRDFARNIDSILLQRGALKNLRGLILGRFPSSYRLRKRELQAFVAQRPHLKGIPILYDFPCGHFSESLYLPLAEELVITATSSELSIRENND